MYTWLKKYHIFSKILALFIAIVLWFIVMSVLNPEMDITFFNVKVTVIGKTELYNTLEYTILSDTDLEMDISLTGKRNEILMLKKSDIELVCDVSKISGDGDNRIACTVNTPYSNLTVNNAAELSMTVTVDKIIEKEFPVIIETEGALAADLRLGELTAAPAYVKVKGPTTELSTVSHAIVKVSLDGVTDNTTELCDAVLIGDNGERAAFTFAQQLTKATEVTVPVSLVREIPLKVTINAGGGLTEHEVTVVTTPSKISLLGDRSAIDEIEFISLGMIDLDGIGDGVTTEKQIVLPSGITCLTDRTSATVMVTVNNIQVRSFEITDILLSGSSEEYDVDFISKSVNVRLRGNSTLLENVTADDFLTMVNVYDLDIKSAGLISAPVSVIFKPTNLNLSIWESDYRVTLIAVKKTDG